MNITLYATDLSIDSEDRLVDYDGYLATCTKQELTIPQLTLNDGQRITVTYDADANVYNYAVANGVYYFITETYNTTPLTYDVLLKVDAWATLLHTNAGTLDARHLNIERTNIFNFSASEIGCYSTPFQSPIASIDASKTAMWDRDTTEFGWIMGVQTVDSFIGNQTSLKNYIVSSPATFTTRNSFLLDVNRAITSIVRDELRIGLEKIKNILWCRVIPKNVWDNCQGAYPEPIIDDEDVTIGYISTSFTYHKQVVIGINVYDRIKQCVKVGNGIAQLDIPRHIGEIYYNWTVYSKSCGVTFTVSIGGKDYDMTDSITFARDIISINSQSTVSKIGSVLSTATSALAMMSPNPIVKVGGIMAGVSGFSKTVGESITKVEQNSCEAPIAQIFELKTGSGAPKLIGGFAVIVYNLALSFELKNEYDVHGYILDGGKYQNNVDILSLDDNHNHTYIKTSSVNLKRNSNHLPCGVDIYAETERLLNTGVNIWYSYNHFKIGSLLRVTI